MPFRKQPSFLRPALVAVLSLGIACGMAAAQGSSSFYSDGNGFLSVVDPVLLGEDGFVARMRTSAGGEKPFGLILSGGSARAFAHIGVLEVLEEEGLRPDFLVADSMGAIVALLYGAGVAPEDIIELFSAYSASELFDAELPKDGGFLDAGRFMGLVRAIVGDLDLSRIPIPALIACEDLPSRRQVLLAEGDFATVMAAAFALPAVFEPVPFRGMLLIDGGVTNLVPVEAAYRYSDRIAAATALYGREMDFSSPFVVINRAIDIGKTRSSIAGLLEKRPVVVRCAVEDLSYMQFSRPAEVAARGRESAREALPELKALASSRPMSPELAERRAFFHERIAMLVAAKKLGARFEAPRDILVKTELRLLDEASGGEAVFSGRRWAGLEAELRGGPAAFSLSALTGLEGRAERQWGVGLGLSLDGYVLPSREASGLASGVELKALLSGSGLLDSALSPPEVRELAMAARTFLSFAPARGLVLRPEAAAEFDLGIAEGEMAWKASLGMDLEADALAGLELGLAAEADSLGNLGPGGRAGLSWEKPGIAALRLSGLFHAALEGPGLEASTVDPYRSLALGGEAGLRSLSSAEAVWLASVLEMSFGELVIVQRPELGAYVDVSTADEAFRVTVGGTASAGFSIMGLAPMFFSAYAGLGTDGSGWAIGLRAGLR